ncbi:MAG: hypothetical protein AAFX99_28375, partial [Myxococcota bacterium]
MQHSDLNQTFARMAEAMNREFGGLPSKEPRHTPTTTQDVAPMSVGTELRQAAHRVLSVARTHLAAVAAPSEPPPQVPDLQEVLAKAQANAAKLARIRGGLQVWREAVIMYRDVRRGHPITAMKMWGAFRRVNRSASRAASAAWRRTLNVAALDTAARIIAWRTADATRDQLLARAIHGVAKRIAGRAALAFAAVDTFKVMHRDIKRYNSGELSQ